MRSGYSFAIGKSKMLNHTMMQAVKIMRMNQTDLHEFLAQTVERNPFLEIEGSELVAGGSSENGALPEFTCEDRISLYRHLADQFFRIVHTEAERRVALAFLQEIDPNGWLITPVESIARTNGLDIELCHTMLTRLQTLEPVGVFARDLAECLRLQAIDQGLCDDVMEGLLENLNTLAAEGLESLARRLQVDIGKLALRLEQIRRMTPRPGAIFGFNEIHHTDCDVVLNVTDQGLTCELRRSSYPTVRVSFDGVFREQKKDAHLAEMRALLAEAKAVQSAIETRKSTTLAVVAAVFARQREFLFEGYAALSPMRMSDIAGDINVSEATVSRIVSGLSIHCPLGHITLKSLFCSSVSSSGQTQTRHVALNIIKNLIADEDKTSPLSDCKIRDLIQASGVEISRRTVSKYRQLLKLPPPATRRKHAELSHLLERARQADAPTELRDNPDRGRCGETADTNFDL